MTIKKAYDISLLTREEKIRLDLSGLKSDYLGIRGDTLIEPFILPQKAKSETRLTGDNGQMISLTRDTPRDIGSGYSAQTGAASITLGVGYNSNDPARTTKENPQGGKAKPLVGIRNSKTTASEIIVSQKTDTDDNLSLAPGNIGMTKAKSAISVYSDSIRICGREGIKFVTGMDDKNSAGGKIVSVPRFNFIGGNSDGNLQPVALANTLNEVLRDIYEQIDTLNSVIDTFMTSQVEFNAEVMTHQHYDLATMLVGSVSSGNPFSINSGKNLVSPELMSSGIKTMSTEYISKIDGIFQKLQTTVGSFNATDAAGPKNPASPSLFST
tara:strand:+ start:1060 stop:2037 length:978 start_codon:yes stop_codon:yes gene_type:complete